MPSTRATPSVLYVELPGFKPLPQPTALAVSAGGFEVLGVTSVGGAEAVCRSTQPPAIVVSNAPDYDLLTLVREAAPAAHTVLVSDLTMSRVSELLKDDERRLLGHIVAHNEGADWCVDELRITIQKLVRVDMFGIEKYLATGTPVTRAPVRGGRDRAPLNEEVRALAQQYKLGSTVSKMAYAITEELLMNAIYDAPQSRRPTNEEEASDAPKKRVDVSLAPDEEAELSFGCDGRVLAISVTDPFGAFEEARFRDYVHKVVERQEGADIIDRKEGGAGLGLVKILYNSHAMLCNCLPGVRTEVAALVVPAIPLRDFSKMARSVHYFTQHNAS